MLSIRQFQHGCISRTRKAFPEQSQLPEYLALAIAGETGEMCNLLKKVWRGDCTLQDNRKAILKELADIITYSNLLMSVLDADVETELVEKFEEVSKRIDYKLGMNLKEK